MSDKGQKIFYWLPRIACISCAEFGFILAFGAFAEKDWTPLEKIMSFLMQLSPFLILIIPLLIAWKRESIGGISYIILGIANIAYMFLLHPEMWYNSFILSGPLLFIGALFIIYYLNFEIKNSPLEI